ncbi:MAG: glycosyltransferase family 39 protein [Candidatus Omnitrophica bacterium]|nr:glycosyltransferase family 39 protein [Candidatus Omnitrophota bacterium]
MTLLLILWILTNTLALGRWLLRRFRFEFANSLEHSAFGFALGYGIFGYVIYFAGLLGLLYRVFFAVLLGMMTAVLWREIVDIFRQTFGSIQHLFRTKVHRTGTFSLLVWIAFVFILGFAYSMLPPTAHDALCYHIHIPKRFVDHHKIVYLPYLVNSLFPFLIQMYYTVALLFKYPEGTGLCHWLTAVGTFLGVVSLTRTLFSVRWGMIAGLVFILTPGIFYQSVIPYNDMALTFYTFFALYALLHSLSSKKDLPWIVLMGIYSGFALSVKYLAALHILALALILLGLGISRKWLVKEIVKKLLVYAAVVFLFSFIWYMRSYYHEGNPFYPFFASIFGGTGKEYDLAKQGFGKSLWDFILVSWRLTMHPERFGGSWTQVGAIFLTCLPLLIFRRYPTIPLRILAVFSLIFFMEWFFLVQNLRFLFPVIPALSILVTLSISAYLPILIFLMAFNTVLILGHGREHFQYLLGRESRAAYLTTREPTYSVSQWINAHLPRGSKILNVEAMRMFYFDPEVVRESEYRKKTRYDRKARSIADVLKQFRQDGIHYILLTYDPATRTGYPPFDIRSLLTQKDFLDQYVTLIHESRWGSGRNAEIVYKVYKIHDIGDGGLES